MPEAQRAYILLTLLPRDRMLDTENAVAILSLLGYEVSVEDICTWKQPNRAQLQTSELVCTWVREQFERAPAASVERDVWFRVLRDISNVSDANLSLYKGELCRQVHGLLDELAARALLLQCLL